MLANATDVVHSMVCVSVCRCVCMLDMHVSCTNMADLIVSQFGIVVYVPQGTMLDKGSEMHRWEWAILRRSCANPFQPTIILVFC